MGMTTDQRLTLGRERAIEGRSLADLHREAVKLAVDIERERCARICEGRMCGVLIYEDKALQKAADDIRKDPAQRA